MKEYKGFKYPESMEEATQTRMGIRLMENPVLPYIMITNGDIVINTGYTIDDLILKHISYEELEEKIKELIDNYIEEREKRKARE